MFRGQYIRAVDSRGRFNIPRSYLEILNEEAGDDTRVLVLMPMQTLRVYPWSLVKELQTRIAKMPVTDRGPFNTLVRRVYQSAFSYSKSGHLTIPKEIRRQYWLFPGMQLLLSGHDDYFFIEQWLE